METTRERERILDYSISDHETTVRDLSAWWLILPGHDPFQHKVCFGSTEVGWMSKGQKTEGATVRVGI